MESRALIPNVTSSRELRRSHKRVGRIRFDVGHFPCCPTTHGALGLLLLPSWGGTLRVLVCDGLCVFSIPDVHCFRQATLPPWVHSLLASLAPAALGPARGPAAGCGLWTTGTTPTSPLRVTRLIQRLDPRLMCLHCCLGRLATARTCVGRWVPISAQMHYPLAQ